MVKTPFNYADMYYNEIILEIETKWNRRLSDHERHLLIEGYKYGRLAEMENELKILEVK